MWGNMCLKVVTDQLNYVDKCADAVLKDWGMGNENIFAWAAGERCIVTYLPLIDLILGKPALETSARFTSQPEGKAKVKR